jgi:hypothetical protein
MSGGLKRLGRSAECDEPGRAGRAWRISTLPRFGVKWTDGLLARQADF